MKKPLIQRGVRRERARPKIGDRVEFLRDAQPFRIGDQGTVETAGSLAIGIVLDRDPGRALTLIGETDGVVRIRRANGG